MKRYVGVLLSCLLAVTASAQSTLGQKVAKAVKEAPEQVSVAMERDLIQYYHDGEVKKVDMILMQHPLLANTHIIGENGQRISMVYDAFLRDDLPMLEVFYKHGMECEQCLKKSFASIPNDKQELTFQYQLPIYMEKHRTQLEPAYKQLTKGQPQVPFMEFPQVSVEFLDKTYKPTTVREVDAAIKKIEKNYQIEFRTKYLCEGQTTPPAKLTAARDGAISRLEKARAQLIKYEEWVKQQNSNREARDAANKQITQAVKMFNGQADLVAQFFKHFPEEDVFNWSYHPVGINLTKIDFKIPVLYDTKKWIAYDARPETFGTVLLDKAIPHMQNSNEARHILATFAGAPGLYWRDERYGLEPHWDTIDDRVESVFYNPKEPDRLYFIFGRKSVYREYRYIHINRGGWVTHSRNDFVLIEIQYGARNFNPLSCDYSRFGWENKMIEQGYIRLY